MLIPVRCFTCGKVIASKWAQYQEEKKTRSEKDVLDSLGMRRYCCRRMFLSQVDLIDKLLLFESVKQDNEN